MELLFRNLRTTGGRSPRSRTWRVGVLGLVVVFGVLGSPNFARTGLGSTGRTEEESKAPLVEEELRCTIAVPESLSSRTIRLRMPRCQNAASSQHLGDSVSRGPSRLTVMARRVLDKQNGLGAFLRC